MAAEKKPALIWVKAGDPARIGITERDPAHPGGEVLVVGTEPTKVAETPRVLEFLQTGQLVRVTGPEGEMPGAAGKK